MPATPEAEPLDCWLLIPVDPVLPAFVPLVLFEAVPFVVVPPKAFVPVCGGFDVLIPLEPPAEFGSVGLLAPSPRMLVPVFC